MGVTGEYTNTNYKVKDEPKLLEQVRSAIITRHYSMGTEDA